MKNILLLTDFSDNAQNAIDYALQFFKGGIYNFFLLNVHKISKYTTGDLMTSTATTSVYDSIIKNPKAALDGMIDEYNKKYNDEDYSFTAICDYDSFVGAVNQTVNLKYIDLIVMGTNGATGAKEVVFGSNTLNVIRNVNCPVLVIPIGYKHKKLTNILYATEHDEIFSKESLKPLVHIISKHDTVLEILMLEKKVTITNSSNDKKKAVAVFFKGIKHRFYSIVNVPADVAIDCFVQLNQVSLIAKIINRKSFFNRLVSGSTTDDITYKSSVPLLIMHS